MADYNRIIQQLLAESKRLSDLADKIRQRMDAVTEEIAQRAVGMEKSKITPPPWTFDPNPPKNAAQNLCSLKGLRQS